MRSSATACLSRKIGLFVFFLFLGGAMTGSPHVAAELDYIAVSWDNDIVAGKDGGGYTNGIYFSWVQRNEPGAEHISAPLLTLPLAWMLDDAPTYAYKVHSIGQAMVTPEDITKEVPDPDDAPYAGLLFLRSSYVVVKDDFADHVATLVGVVGPSSGAEEVQKSVHKLVGSDQPKGWDYQLDDKFVWQLQRTAIWRFSSTDSSPYDAVLLGDLAVGNIESLVGAGLYLRAGSGLARSYSTMSFLGSRVSTPIAVSEGWYVYLGGTGNYVHNQILVDANEFETSASNKLEHYQYSLMAGFTYAWESVSVCLSYQSDTEPNKSQTARKNFGAITLAWQI
ncbi:lipid A deacylase LpxR family protein [Cellvibrio sp. NN19]|uniref:lipid A deacylase LpxR family protein n=1 Tax=Cellvibrio chitinivorans TaxID=3102792 RepID=UPI002B402FF0|nr:lipid A deacylase LpxR family protein [Cellvibrio sp. NN19]